MEFTNTTGEDLLLAQIDIVAVKFDPNSNSGFFSKPTTVSLYAEVGGVPGSVLESWTVNLPCCATATTTLLDSSGVVLQNGVDYFVGILFPSDTLFAGWFWNNVGVDGRGATSTDGGATWTPSHPVFHPNSVFDVIGATLPTETTVPEPGSALLIGAGVVGIAARMKRRHPSERAFVRC
jgi:hypothetical protein